jgi:hypothetical protein
MADEHRPERPAIDFGKGSREQTQSGTGLAAAVPKIEPMRQAPSKRTRRAERDGEPGRGHEALPTVLPGRAGQHHPV